jgi:hypothetical protein
MFGMRIVFPHKVARRAGLSIQGSALSLEGGFDSMRVCSNHQEELAKSQASQARSKRLFNDACIRDGIEWSGPWHGQINLSGCCSGLNASSSDTTR